MPTVLPPRSVETLSRAETDIDFRLDLADALLQAGEVLPGRHPSSLSAIIAWVFG